MDIGEELARRTRSLMTASTRSPSVSPGPRNDLPDVRFALSYDALKTKGTPSRRGQSGEFGRQGGGVGFAFDDTWTRHQHEGATAADRDVSNRESWHGGHYRRQEGAGRAGKARREGARIRCTILPLQRNPPLPP